MGKFADDVFLRVDWPAKGHGKRGGARVIYFCASNEIIWLLIAYTKAKWDTLSAAFLAELRKGIEDVL